MAPVTMGSRAQSAYMSWWSWAYQNVRPREGPLTWETGKNKQKYYALEQACQMNSNRMEGFASFTSLLKCLFLRGNRQSLVPCLFGLCLLILYDTISRGDACCLLLHCVFHFYVIASCGQAVFFQAEHCLTHGRSRDCLTHRTKVP
jgi:hypothetical protein